MVPILLKKSKIERLPKSRESRCLDVSTAAMLARPDTNVRGRFCVKRCGPSRRNVRNASAVLKNFVRRPEETFATVTADIRRDDGYVSFVPILLQKSFCIGQYKFSGPYALRSNSHLWDYMFCDELTSDFGNALAATSVGDRGSFDPFAGNLSHSISGVLQQHLPNSDIRLRPHVLSCAG
jgi:hypothetical protein